MNHAAASVLTNVYDLHRFAHPADVVAAMKSLGIELPVQTGAARPFTPPPTSRHKPQDPDITPKATRVLRSNSVTSSNEDIGERSGGVRNTGDDKEDYDGEDEEFDDDNDETYQPGRERR
jgi:hypothetical protein